MPKHTRLSVGEPRVHYKRAKVAYATDTGHQIPRFFLIDSKNMQMELPGDKIKKISQEATKLQKLHNPSALELSRFLGKLNHASQVIQPAPLFYRSLQSCLQTTLSRSNQDYSHQTRHTGKTKEELIWWEHQMTNWNGKAILKQTPTLVTHPQWVGERPVRGYKQVGHSQTETRLHINCLERRKFRMP